MLFLAYFSFSFILALLYMIAVSLNLEFIACYCIV